MCGCDDAESADAGLPAPQAGEVHQLGAYRSAFFPLKRLELTHRSGAGHTEVVVPAHWTSGLTDADRFWVGDPDGAYRVHLAAVGGPVNDRPRSEKARIQEALKPVRALGLIGKPTIADSNDVVIVEAKSEHPPTAGEHRGHHILQLWTDGKLEVITSFSVYVARDRWDTPEAEDIIALFRQHAVRLRPTDTPQLEDVLPPADPGWKNGFRNLRTVRPFGFMSLNLPARWKEDKSDPDLRAYYRPQEPPIGTLYIAWEAPLQLPANAGTRKIDRTMFEREEDGEKLTYVRWTVFDATDRLVLVMLDLVLLAGQETEPEYQDLIRILDFEIGRMRIGRPPEKAED